MRENLKAAVETVLDRESSCYKQKDGSYEVEIYADYRDKMDYKTAADICSSDDLRQALAEKLYEWYADYECQSCCELEKAIHKELTSDGGPYPDGLSDDDEEDIKQLLWELVCWKYPVDHFLNQAFKVNIMLDTGDGNYDYTLNSPYPCWYGRYEDRLNNKSSLLWLARQQGYTKSQLWDALRDEKPPPSMERYNFLDSCRVELANLSSHMAILTFLVSMTLEQLIELNRCIKLQDRNGHFFDATENPYCGYIILDKSTMAGLFDPWAGCGSVLDIQLEKDVRIPIRFIRSALPDGCDTGYGVSGVYDMSASAWKDTVKKISAPRNVEKLEAAS